MSQTTTIQLWGRFLTNELDPNSNDPTKSGFFDLPAGKWLTIESISTEFFGPQGQSAAVRLVVRNQKSGFVQVVYQIPLQYQVSFSPALGSPLRDVWSANQPMKAYIPTGSRLEVGAMRGPETTGISEVTVVITGYFDSLTLIKFPWPPF